MIVRPARERDLPDLLQLYGELHSGDPAVPAERAAQLWSEIAGQPGRTVLLAELDGAPVGTLDCVCLANLTRGGRPFMLIENVVVASSARRQGIGSQLLDAALELARVADCYKVQLLSRSDRVEAHAFYEAAGFHVLAQGYRIYLPQTPGQHPVNIG